MTSPPRNYNVPSSWRTITQTDPHEAHEIWVARHAQATEDYLAGTITVDVFAATLYALGFRNSDLTAELHHYEGLKEERDNG